MAETFKVRYKNYCIPQEQPESGGRYYLDSDCGRKLTGDAEKSIGQTETLSTGVSITDIGTPIIASKDFVYVKNTGSNDVFIALTLNALYVIKLSEGEAFSSEISTSAIVQVKCGSGETSTIEYFPTGA